MTILVLDTSIHLLASKCPDFVAIAKQRNMVQFCELVAMRRRVGGTDSAALFACIEGYDKESRKQNRG